MFDIGFWELCLVGLVSLLVIGPERLPKAARIAGFWVAKTRNIVNSVKAEIKEELQAEDIRQSLIEQVGVDELKQTIGDVSGVTGAAKEELSKLSKAASTGIQRND